MLWNTLARLSTEFRSYPALLDSWPFSTNQIRATHNNKDANFSFAFIIHSLLHFNSSHPHLLPNFDSPENMVKTTQNHHRVGPSKPPATIPAASPAPTSKLPPQIRFPLLVVLSLTISSSLYSLVSPFTSGDLATVSRSRDNWLEIVGFLSWKATELAIGWYGGFDSTNQAFPKSNARLTHVL